MFLVIKEIQKLSVYAHGQGCVASCVAQLDNTVQLVKVCRDWSRIVVVVASVCLLCVCVCVFGGRGGEGGEGNESRPWHLLCMAMDLAYSLWATCHRSFLVCPSLASIC